MANQTTTELAYTQFGIDQVCFFNNRNYELAKKLKNLAHQTLDGNNEIVAKHVGYDMVFIFNNASPNIILIYRYLQHLHNNPNEEINLRLSGLDEKEILKTINKKTFVFISPNDLIKE